MTVLDFNTNMKDPSTVKQIDPLYNINVNECDSPSSEIFHIKDSKMNTVAHKFENVSPDLDDLENLFHISDTTAMFIDGTHVYNCARNMGIKLDYGQLLQIFNRATRLVQANYFINVEDSDKHDDIIPLIDYLGFNGYAVNVDYVDRAADNRINTAVYHRLITDMFVLCLNKQVNHIVLFAGSKNYAYAIEKLQKVFAIKVTVVSILQANNATQIVSSALRQAAGQFFNLNNIKDSITRNEKK